MGFNSGLKGLSCGETLSHILASLSFIAIYIQKKRRNVTQFIYILKMLYMFRVVPTPIIRSAYNCIYSIWYLSHRYCYLPLSATGSSNGVTNNRCCRHSCMRSWWWVEVPPKTCRVPVSRYK